MIYFVWWFYEEIRVYKEVYFSYCSRVNKCALIHKKSFEFFAKSQLKLFSGNAETLKKLKLDSFRNTASFCCVER